MTDEKAPINRNKPVRVFPTRRLKKPVLDGWEFIPTICVIIFTPIIGWWLALR